MSEVTEADRDAARALREILADISGFWYRIEDDGPLCAALARHRAEAEQRLIGKLTPVGRDEASGRSEGRHGKGAPRIHEIAPQPNT